MEIKVKIPIPFPVLTEAEKRLEDERDKEMAIRKAVNYYMDQFDAVGTLPDGRRVMRYNPLKYNGKDTHGRGC